MTSGTGTSLESGATPRPEGEADCARQAKGKSRGTSRKKAGTLHSTDGVSVPDVIVRSLRVEIVAPVGGVTWAQLRSELHLYWSSMHLLYNAAIFGAALEQETGQEVYELDGTSRVYQMVKLAVFDLRGKAQKGFPQAGFNPCGAIMTAVSREAEQKLRKWTKDGKRDRIPSYKYGAPIPNPSVVSDVFIDGTDVLIRFKLAGGRRSGGDWTVRVAASKGGHWSRLRQIANGEVKRGAIKITYDERKKKWYAIIAYSEPEPQRTELDPANALVVHRGQHNWLYAISTTGKCRVLARGNQYRARRRAIEARRRSMNSACKGERGSGSHGHGRKRRYAAYNSVGDLLDRINRTTCQQLAASVVKLAREWGCGRVFIEDYGGIRPDEDRGVRRFVDRFPLYQLKESIAWALRNAGIPLGEVESEYISSICPHCGNVDTSQHNHRTGVFHCKRCGCERPADFVAAYHMMRRSGVESPEWDRKMRIDQEMTDTMHASGEVVKGVDQQESSEIDGPRNAAKRTSRKACRK